MTITLERPDLSALSAGELSELATIAADDWADAVAAERSRRERVKRMTARRVKLITGDFVYAAEAQYAQARTELRGHLLARGSKLGDEWQLWSGNEATARANATSDLCDWWDTHPRITATGFDDQLSAQRKVYEDDRMERDAGGGVRPAGSGEEGARDHRDRAGHPVPAAAAVSVTQGHAGGSAAARPGFPVRGGSMTTTDTCLHADDSCTHKSATGRAIRAARMGAQTAPQPAVGAFGSPAQVAVREPSAVAYAAPEQAIDGAVVLRAIRVCLGYFAIWPSDEALNAATLYVAAAHARSLREIGGAAWLLPVWQYMPRFFLTSEEGGSGKSWMGRLMLSLCPNGKSLVEPTKASLIQLISEMATVSITELDMLLSTGGRNKGIVAVANAGYEPEHLHSRMASRKAQQVPLFGPMILDGLDSLIKSTGTELRTLFSRCIIVHAKRAPAGYRPPRFDNAARAQFKQVRELAAQWMNQAVQAGIGECVPELPDGVGNRAAALWEPLCSVADWAGGEWPDLARRACERLESSTGIPPEEAEEQARVSPTLASWAAAQGMQWDAGTEGSEGDEWS